MEPLAFKEAQPLTGPNDLSMGNRDKEHSHKGLKQLKNVLEKYSSKQGHKTHQLSAPLGGQVVKFQGKLESHLKGSLDPREMILEVILEMILEMILER